MKWLAPLIILVILVIFGAWFCSTHPEPPPSKPAANVNANKANTGGNVNSPANTNTAANTNAAADNKPANANASRY